MTKLLTILLLALAPACALFRSEGGLDLGALADQVALVRQDVADLAPLASPETQLRLAELDKAVHGVEDALRAAGAGGPVTDVTTAAQAALAVADQLLQAMPQDEVGDIRLYVGLARIALRHLAAARFDDADEALEPVVE